MKVTRKVVKDLLPKYFSGEASEDTRRMVEEYFRQDPDFERAARAEAKPRKTLQGASAEAEPKGRDREGLGLECGSQRGWLGMAVYFTVWPLVPLVSSGLGAWLGAPHTWAGRIVDWSMAAFFLVMYILRPGRRDFALVWAIFVSLGETALILNRLGVIRDQGGPASNLAVIGIGALAALFWFWHVRSRMVVQR
jgi:hypothetical protein